jgi:uncharacterized protein YxeA
MNKLIISIIYLLMVGCTGSVYTVENPKLDKDGRIKGILVYGYKIVPKKTTLDRVRNPQTGEITHSAYEKKGSNDYCEPDVKIDNVAVADYSKPYAIQYDSSLFEISKFGVTLDKGMLASVNSESTPGPKAAVESLQALASLREDVLNGYVESSSSLVAKDIEKNLDGSIPKKLPIRCSLSE